MADCINFILLQTVASGSIRPVPPLSSRCRLHVAGDMCQCQVDTPVALPVNTKQNVKVQKHLVCRGHCCSPPRSRIDLEHLHHDHLAIRTGTGSQAQHSHRGNNLGSKHSCSCLPSTWMSMKVWHDCYVLAFEGQRKFYEILFHS